MKNTMRPRLHTARPCSLRIIRNDPGGAALESIAAEFALLAQRRARIARQVDLLRHQLTAAEAGLAAVSRRMGMLAQRMDAIDPALRPPPQFLAPQALPQALPQAPPPGAPPYYAAQQAYAAQYAAPPPRLVAETGTVRTRQRRAYGPIS